MVGSRTQSRVIAQRRSLSWTPNYPTTDVLFQRELQTKYGHSFSKRHWREGREIRTGCMEEEASK